MIATNMTAEGDSRTARSCCSCKEQENPKTREVIRNSPGVGVDHEDIVRRKCRYWKNHIPLRDAHNIIRGRRHQKWIETSSEMDRNTARSGEGKLSGYFSYRLTLDIDGKFSRPRPDLLERIYAYELSSGSAFTVAACS